jgi:hypothetical protein
MVRSGPVSYLPYDAVHHDHYAEHVTKVIAVVGPEQRCVLNSRSGVLWWEWDQADVSDSTLQAMLSKADTGAPLAVNHDSPSFETPDGFENALSGWHSSMEQSQQSDMLNAVAAGELPPKAHDDNDPYPYLVVFGDTHNVCSQPADVYGSPELRDVLKEYFGSARAAPGYAGFK